MKRRAAVLGGVLLTVLIVPALAQTRNSQATRAQLLESRTLESQRINPGLSASERRSARQWHLSDDEWQRYQRVLQGIRGSLSVPTISPIEVLGIHAETAAERRHYAELWAQMMFEDTARVLAFQREYDAAFKRLFEAVPLIEQTLLPLREPLLDLQPGDRLMLFVRRECMLCTTVLKRVMATVVQQRGLGLDIYLLDTAGEADDAAIRAWAQTQEITPEQVASRRVTLNHDQGVLARLAPQAAVPALIHRRGQDYTSITAVSLPQ